MDLNFFSIDVVPPLLKIDESVLTEDSRLSSDSVLVTLHESPATVLRRENNNFGIDDPKKAVRNLADCGDVLHATVCDALMSQIPDDCSSFRINVDEATIGTKRFQLTFSAKDGLTKGGCALAVVAYLASRPQVVAIEAPAQVESLSRHLMEVPSALPLSDGTTPPVVPQNMLAAMALQGATSDDGTMPLWDAGLTGEGQLLQVTDTGVDDASCWLRDTCTGTGDDDAVRCDLTGDVYNSEMQVPRSNYTMPLTDFSYRKVVQYIAYPDTVQTGRQFGYDGISGHGTHVAGSVAGSLTDTTFEEYENCSTAMLSIGASNVDGQYVKVEYSYPIAGADVDFIYYSPAQNLSLFRLFSTYWAIGNLVEINADLWTFADCDTLTMPELLTECTFTNELVGSCFEESDGVAPDAQLLAYDFGDENGTLTTPQELDVMMYAPAYDVGATISTNSWGGGYAYDPRAYDVDKFMYENDDFLILFAAGNDGYSDGDVSIKAPGVAKNCLTIGAAENTKLPVTTVASFSSRGPTSDGRIKPDVIAPGDALASAEASGERGLATCAATWKSGTSMATPACAGLVALMRQFLVDGYHETVNFRGFNASKYNVTRPSGALMKAMVIASTQAVQYGYLTTSSSTPVDLALYYNATPYPLGTMGPPDYHQGFGVVNASRVLPLASNFDLYLYDGVLSDWDVYDLAFDATASETVTITLVWTDPPAATSCTFCLVHDLDLEVYIGTTPYFSNFGSPGSPDTVNNVEKVTLRPNLGDRIQIRVLSGALAAADEQKFALVIVGKLQNVVYDLTIPTAAPVVATPVPSRDFSCDILDLAWGYSNTDGLYVRVDDVEYGFYYYNSEHDNYLYQWNNGNYWMLGSTLGSGSSYFNTLCSEVTFPEVFTSCTWSEAPTTYDCYAGTKDPTIVPTSIPTMAPVTSLPTTTPVPTPSPFADVPTPVPVPAPTTDAPSPSFVMACTQDSDCPGTQTCSSPLSSPLSLTSRRLLFISFNPGTVGICV